MNYLHICLDDVTKVTIERHEYGVRLSLHNTNGYPMQTISLHGVKDFVEVEDLTVPPRVEPMIVL